MEKSKDLPIFCDTYQQAEDLAGANETIMVKVHGDPRYDKGCWAIVNYPITGLPDDEEWEEDDRRG